MPAPPPADRGMHRATGFFGAAGVIFIGILASGLVFPPAPPATGASGSNAGRPCSLRPPGYLRGRFFGAVDLRAEWSGAGLVCEGMQRPDGNGVRLFFAGEQPGGGRLSVLIGIDGRTEDLAGGERPANVTVIDERESRFFGTRGSGRCWTIISKVAVLPRSRDYPAGHRIDGVLYCLGTLPSLGDRTSLTLGDLHFAGRVAADEG